MKLPNEAQCLALLRKYTTPEHIIMHSVRVCEVGKVVAEGLIRGSNEVDRDLVRAACLLHDIAKYPCIVSGEGFHDRKGEEMLTAEGLPAVGRIVGQHVHLRDSYEESVNEAHVLFYGDKRVVHDRLVTVEQRFEYLIEQYGRSPDAVSRIEGMREKTLRLEERIFSLLDFTPDDVFELVARFSSERSA